MSLVIISSSQRKNSNSMRTARYLEAKVQEKELFEEVLVMDLAEINLPFWDDCMWAKGTNPLKEQWAPIKAELDKAQGFIFVTPEWSGMASPALHNFILFCSAKELGHKPALLTSVSTGIGGAYPISELRMSSYKNTRLCYLPEHLILRSANNFFDESKQDDEHVVQMKERIDQTLSLLKTYTEAFKQIRETHSFDLKKFPNGM